MSNKRALNLSLEPEIIAWLDQIMEKRHYTSRSILVEELIRERHDEVFGTGKEEVKQPGSTTLSNLRYPSVKDQLNEANETSAAAAPPPAKKKKAA